MDDVMQHTPIDNVAAMSRTLARAFADDPVLAILFGGPPPADRTTRFFEVMTHMQLAHGHVYNTPGNEAAAIWAPPGHWKIPVLNIIKNSPALIKVLGRRLVPTLGILGLLEKNHPTAPHYYLEFIGTDPAYQGKGFGARLMQPIIEQCDREGVGAYLESSKEANLAFYGRFGFVTTKVLTHKAGPQQWLMWRDPK
jgi:ribosomal protein S18 acetylase RimI-like enzyme